MSDDFYDSLEDECNHSRGSSNSLELQQTVSVKMVSKFRSLNRHSSFCFRNKKEKDFSPSTKAVSVNTRHKNNFLPVINNKNSIPGLQELFNHSADYETLAKKGLLLNRDGSFTKSKSDAEELPFITREYKNLVFQKQKAYNSKKKTQTKKFLEKQPSNCDLCCSDQKNIEIIKRKNVFKESTKTDKNSLMNDNLTDSMKRILLQNKTQKDKQNAGQNLKVCFSETKTLRHRFSKKRENNAKNCKPLDKHLSQSALTGQKHNLTYLERHQLQNGYNPRFLRHGLKNIMSDTTRSTFGDSVIGKLSEVSSRVFSDDNIADLEAEEEFYKEIMEKDRNRMIKPENNNVLGQPLEISEHGCKIESDIFKQLEKLRESGRNYKRILKPLYIDLKNDGERGANKCSHFCSENASPKISKNELALKGKTYGFLANARNILKFKYRMEAKISGRENLSPKNNAADLCLKQGSELTKDFKKKSLPRLSLEKNMRDGIELKSEEMQNQVRNTKDQKRFCLPRISSSEYKNHNINSKNLMRINSCAYCPGL